MSNVTHLPRIFRVEDLAKFKLLTKEPDEKFLSYVIELLDALKKHKSGKLHDSIIALLSNDTVCKRLHKLNVLGVNSRMTALLGRAFTKHKNAAGLEEFQDEESAALSEFKAGRSVKNKPYAIKIAQAISELTKAMNGENAVERELPLVRSIVKVMRTKYKLALTEDPEEFDALHRELEEDSREVQKEKLKLERLIGNKVTILRD